MTEHQTPQHHRATTGEQESIEKFLLRITRTVLRTLWRGPRTPQTAGRAAFLFGTYEDAGATVSVALHPDDTPRERQAKVRVINRRHYDHLGHARLILEPRPLDLTAHHDQEPTTAAATKASHAPPHHQLLRVELLGTPASTLHAVLRHHRAPHSPALVPLPDDEYRC